MSDILIGQIASAVQLQGSISGDEQLKGSFDLFKLPEHQYSGSYLVTPNESEQVLPTSGRTVFSDIKVSPIPSEYVVPSGTITITENGTEDVTQYASASVNVPIPSGYIIPSGTINISASGETDVTQYATASVPKASFELSASKYYHTTSGGQRKWHDGVSTTPPSPDGWWGGVKTTATTYNAVPSNTTIIPSTSSQTIGGSNYMMESAVTVSPIPSQYIVPSGSVTITQQNNTDVTEYESANVVSGVASQGTQFGYTSSGTRWRMRGYNNVTSAGWFESGQTDGAWASFYAVPSGTVVTPTESSQTVGGNDYMMQGAVTVSPIPSQYIIPSGTLSITANANDIDVKNYAEVDVNVPAVSPVLQTVTKTYSPTESSQTETITPSTGYDGIGQVGITVSPISSTYIGSNVPRKSSANLTASKSTVTAPSGYYQSNATYTMGAMQGHQSISVNSNGLITATYEFLSAGYVASGSTSTTSQLTSQAAQTLYPSTADQTITSGKYLTGTQTFKGVTTSNISADNIKSGVIVKVGDSADDDRIISVTGTYSGGGGSSKNFQAVQGTTRTTSSTLTAIGAELTVSKTGTYDVYWSGFRSSTSASYTYGTQLYVGGVAYGTQNTTWTNHVQNNYLEDVALTQNQKIRVYGRNSRGSSYYIYAPTLVIIEV